MMAQGEWRRRGSNGWTHDKQRHLQRGGRKREGGTRGHENQEDSIALEGETSAVLERRRHHPEWQPSPRWREITEFPPSVLSGLGRRSCSPLATGRRIPFPFLREQVPGGVRDPLRVRGAARRCHVATALRGGRRMERGWWGGGVQTPEAAAEGDGASAPAPAVGAIACQLPLPISGISSGNHVESAASLRTILPHEVLCWDKASFPGARRLCGREAGSGDMVRRASQGLLRSRVPLFRSRKQRLPVLTHKRYDGHGKSMSSLGKERAQ